jgi:hypothetical protein
MNVISIIIKYPIILNYVVTILSGIPLLYFADNIFNWIDIMVWIYNTLGQCTYYFGISAKFEASHAEINYNALRRSFKFFATLKLMLESIFTIFGIVVSILFWSVSMGIWTSVIYLNWFISFFLYYNSHKMESQHDLTPISNQYMSV